MSGVDFVTGLPVPDDIDADQVRDAELMDELVQAVQANDIVKQDALLRQHPHLREWVDCLKSLDSFAPAPEEVAPEFAPTMLAGSAAPASSSSSIAGQFGKYDLLGEIGRGGMGVVYKARQRDLNRIVALKMILASEWASAEEIARFQVEARAAARLRHRNIVGIYEVGEEAGRHFFAMDFVEGQSLSAVIARKPMPTEQAARWMVLIAHAVDHLHTQGLIHRDLKPSNILIDAEGEPMVTDFGLAKAFDTDGGATRTGAILGTPSYMSPEQASGRNALVGVRSDVYSLGAMLYEMLSGRPPFKEENPLDTLVQVLEGEPTLLRRLVANIPPALELICFKCLEKDPERRYATAADLAADLTRYLQGESVEAQSGGVVHKIQRWVRRQPGLASRLAMLVPGVLIIQTYFMTNGTTLAYHVQVMSLLSLWIVMSIILQLLLNRESLANVARVGTMLTDASILTALFTHAYDDSGTLVIVYALLIVVSGLWFQEKLVWWSTAISEVAFALLLLDRPNLTKPWHYPALVMITLIAVGAATSFQVHRVRALSRFYERRPL
ncbi:MAG TPA: serine/threonine-protein kinase [Schlesneria sp.]|jgi:serine/threonine-protein kinase